MSSAIGEATQQRELVICYQCENEWWRHVHGLECPRCHGDFVEIVDPRDDPREHNMPVPDRPISHGMIPSTPNNHSGGAQHPLHDHNPWHDTPNPGEENIDHVSFNPAPGIAFQRTIIHSGARSGLRDRSSNDDTVSNLFQALGGMLHGGLQNQPGANQGQRGGQQGPIFLGPPEQTRIDHGGRQDATHNPFPPPNQRPQHRVRAAWSTTAGGPARNAWNTEDRIFPQEFARNNGNQENQLVGIEAIMRTMIAQMHAAVNQPTPGANNGPTGNGNGMAAMGLPDIFAQIFNSPNGVHGDAVYSQEAFDRILGQMMDQQNGSNAPGPATEAAISALPKKKVDKTMMDDTGNAECSVCMDNVELNDEVTVLPCNHWFHEQCVSLWLREHDTCPHCRKGIMPAEGEPNQPRAPNQPPRHNTNPFDPLSPNPAAPFTQPNMQHPYVPGGYPSYIEPHSYVVPATPINQPTTNSGDPSSNPNSTRSSTRSRRNSEQGRSNDSGTGSGSGGVTGWFRSLRGGSRGSDP